MLLKNYLVTRIFILMVTIQLALTGYVQANNMQTNSKAITGDVVVGKVEYTLPDGLGVLEFLVPLHWVGGRAENIDVLWIDQNSSSFKNNVTLKIHSYDEIHDSEKLLNNYMRELLENVSSVATTEIEKQPYRRFVSMEREIETHKIEQHHLVVYAKTDEKCYLLSLTNSHLKGDEAIDIATAKIN